MSARWAGLIVLAALSVVAAAEVSERRPLPAVDLEALPRPLRAAVTSRLTRLEQVRADPAATRATLAQAYGRLGEISQVHQLWELAAAGYGNAAALAPEDPRWLFYLALLNRQTGELDAALDALEKLLARYPDDPQARISMGGLQLELGRPARALEHLRRALSIDDASALAHYETGKALVAEGDHRGAIRHLERALEIQPAASVVHYLLSQAYRHAGETEKARWHLMRRGDTAIVPTDARLLELRQIVTSSNVRIALSMAETEGPFSVREYEDYVLTHLGDSRAALELLEHAVEGRSSVAQLSRLHYAIGLLLGRAGDEQAALVRFRAAVELVPPFVEAYERMGDIFRRAGMLEQEAQYYGKALDYAPRNTRLLLARATARMGLGRREQAEADLQAVRKLVPGNVESRLLQATLHAMEGRGAAAVKEMEHVLGLDLPDHRRALAHVHLGKLLLQAGDEKRALAEYRLAIEFDPQLTEARLDLARVLFAARRFAEAAEAFGIGSRLDPANGEARQGEFNALVLAGSWAEAKQSLERARDLFPGNLDLTHLLARLLAAAPDRTLRDGPLAATLAREVYERKPIWLHAETLAMALSADGRFEEAVELQRSLIEAATKAGDAATVRRLEADLKLYEERRPCCAEDQERTRFLAM